MMFRKFSNNKGMLLMDILLALSLTTLFIVAISESSAQARNIFARAEEHRRLLDIFEDNLDQFGLSPYESKTVDVNVTGADSAADYMVRLDARGRWFGNDRVETDIAVSPSGVDTASPDGLYSQKISFAAVRAYPPDPDITVAIGTPICSVDYLHGDVVGAYALPTPKTLSITPITLPIDPLLPLTDLEVRNGIAYVSADSAIASDPDILVIDMENMAAPISRSTLSTGPGISAIALVGDLIFAAAASTAAQLHVIRIDSPDRLILENKYRLDLPYATATAPFANSIFYREGLVYLGTEKWDGDELSIIDVSYPGSPAGVGGLEIGSKVNDIFIRGDLAYLAASDIDQLRLIDIRDPADPVIIDSFSPSGWSRQEGKTISSFEDTFAFGRTPGGFDIKDDHELFSSATVPSTTLALTDSTNISGGVYGIIIDRSHIYALTREIDRELRIADHALSTTTATYHSLPVEPQTMTCDGDRLYILAHSAPVIYEISFQ